MLLSTIRDEYIFNCQCRKLSEKTVKNYGKQIGWAMDFEWPGAKDKHIQTVAYADKGKKLFRAATDAAEIMYDHLCAFQEFIVNEIEALMHFREKIEVPPERPVDYIDILDEYHDINGLESFYLENPFSTFYGRAGDNKVEQLYEIDRIEDLFRFEFIKMIENDIFIKKCKNCGRFFIPRRRADTEYCDRVFGETGLKCSKVGATLRYERKVAENPILDAHKKAYRRFNSRVRVKKMTQAEFMEWSEEAARKRDECLAGTLPFEEFAAWLEQRWIRKGRRENKDAKAGGKG